MMRLCFIWDCKSLNSISLLACFEVVEKLRCIFDRRFSVVYT